MGNYSTEIGNENTLQELGPNVEKKQKKLKLFFFQWNFILSLACMCTQGTDLKRNGNFSQNEREKRR